MWHLLRSALRPTAAVLLSPNAIRRRRCSDSGAAGRPMQLDHNGALDGTMLR